MFSHSNKKLVKLIIYERNTAFYRVPTERLYIDYVVINRDAGTFRYRHRGGVDGGRSPANAPRQRLVTRWLEPAATSCRHDTTGVSATEHRSRGFDEAARRARAAHSPLGCSLCGSNHASAIEGCVLAG
ncbi:hypothetical protein EVAR_97354_1 [Eumeta japonica]|uniref:Uncharacterized protein n=1 Tax=Eumeta variegata TaxID=151549 RepID=A0A4C1YY30_EUMVA|nr:hypothetical protein EVAR_97354_1 [Eumeta japonica]